MVLVSIGALMLAISFFLPPIGSIDDSVIKAFGEVIGAVCFLGAWSVIEQAIKNGTDASVTHGNTTISVVNKEEKK